jgi:hypothetical protein
MTVSAGLSVLRLVIQHAPDVAKWLARQFEGGGDPEAAIQRILAMKTPEEIEAEVDAGVLHGEWASRKTGLDIERGAASGLYALICAQKAWKPDSIPADEMAKAVAAHDQAQAAYGEALKAVYGADETTFQTQAAVLDRAVSELSRIKVQYCPFLGGD